MHCASPWVKEGRENIVKSIRQGILRWSEGIPQKQEKGEKDRDENTRREESLNRNEDQGGEPEEKCKKIEGYPAPEKKKQGKAHEELRRSQ